MTVPTIRQLYEEVNYKKLTVAVSIAGHALLPRPRNIAYNYDVGEVPTCSFITDNPAPAWLIEKASIQVFEGFNGRTKMRFNGKIKSISPNDRGLTVQCAGQSEALGTVYKSSIVTTNGSSATSMLEAIFDSAGIFSRYINLGSWTPGTVAPKPLNFQTYADAANKLAEPYASPYMEMPTGLIRVALADQQPAPSAFRTYFSMIKQSDGTYVRPSAVTNASAMPRIRSINVEQDDQSVRNKVTVHGAEVPVTPAPPSGEHDTVVLTSTASGSSPWIPPINGVDQFVELDIMLELLDTPADVAAVASRYFILSNRLNELVSVQVEGDPEMFLGCTVRIINLAPFTGVNAFYFVKGYSTTISENDYVTELRLVGGRSAGVTPRLTPFCMFTWTDAFAAVPPNQDVQSTNNTNQRNAGSKIAQFVPSGVGGVDSGTGIAGKMILVTFRDLSFDPDGEIVSRAWADDDGHTGTGVFFTVAYDPAGPSSVNMTLTVTDNDGNTASQTESVNVSGDNPDDGYDTGGDQSDNGGEISVPAIAVATAAFAVCSPDGGITLNQIAYGCKAVAAQAYKETGNLLIMYGGDDGIITTIDNCVTVFGPPAPFVNVVDLIAGSDGEFVAATEFGQIWRTTNYGDTWTLYATLRGIIKRIAGSIGSLIVAGNLSGQIVPFSVNGGQAPLYVEQGGAHFTPVFGVAGRLSTDSFFMNGSEVFMTGGYNPDYTDASGWLDFSGTFGVTGSLLKAVVPAGDPGTYYLLFGLNFGYFDGTNVTVLGANIDFGPMYDMIGEGGEGSAILLIAGTSNVMKCIDASPAPVSGSLVARGIFDPLVFSIGNQALRLLTVNVPEMTPPGDLYSIV